MKKFTVLSGLAMLAGLLTLNSRISAQITITYSDLPYAGLTVVTATDSLPSVLPGPPSLSAQTWDFSMLGKDSVQTVKFMLTSATPYAADFPAANLADTTIGGNGYNFFDTASNGFSVEGAEENEYVSAISTNFKIEVNLLPTFLQSALPATYGSIVPPSLASGMEQFNVTFSVVITGERFYDSITYNDTVDAWGTLKMPNGKTYNVLRQNHKEIDYEDIYVDELSTWTFYERLIQKKYEYNWYANGIGYILAEMDMDSTSSTVRDVVWDTTAPDPSTLSVNNIYNKGTTSVFPNPCGSQVTFLSSYTSEQYLSVYDIAGRQLEKVSMKNGKTDLNTSMFSNGLYLYQITNNEGNLIDQGKFTVQK